MRRGPWPRPLPSPPPSPAAPATTDAPMPTPSPPPSAPTSTPARRRADGRPSPNRRAGPPTTRRRAEETAALLDWKPVPGSVDDTVTVSGRWTLSYPERRPRPCSTGRRRSRCRAPNRFRINDALIDGEYAVVVAQDELETKPNVATVIDLATGEQVHRRRLLRRADHDRRHLGARRRDAAARDHRAGSRVLPGLGGPRHPALSTPRLVRPATPRLQRRPDHRRRHVAADLRRPAAVLPHRREVDGTGSTPFPGVDGVPGLGRRPARRRRGLVGGPEREPDRGRRTSSPAPATATSTSAPARRAASRRAGTGVLRARPAARRRPGPADALVARRRALRRLRDPGGGQATLSPRDAAATRSRSPR